MPCARLSSQAEQIFSRKLCVHFKENYFMISKIFNNNSIHPPFYFDKYLVVTKYLYNMIKVV